MPAQKGNKKRSFSIISGAYEPEKFESELYEFWESSGVFEAADKNKKGQKAFCIMIPPPNVTGVLHMGHALTVTIEDILTRWKRMSGDNTLWMPGMDHAGIATQTVVEKSIRPKTRHDLGREKFVETTWKWKQEHGGKIQHQMRRMGSSVDWKRERFTMDEGFTAAVREVFVRLHREGLIYRGERIINWCVRCQTALSDLEVVPKERKGSLWHIEYPVLKGEKEIDRITVATTRPETLLGDTAVAVHPKDERYQKLHGLVAQLPLLDRKIPIVLDDYVDQEFGSGAVKITPAHDFNDNDVGKRHQLPLVSVIGKDGKITAAGGPYNGMGLAEARKRVVQDLKEQGYLVKTEEHVHKVGLCQRCDTVAEPVMSKQWFVKIEPLAKPAIEAVESGKVRFYPKTWEKTYFEWMYNIRDWCISRQLWWGHQIPAWHCGDCQDVTVALSAPSKCSQCQGEHLHQDPDVLDTWFSSALWPFATLGWPQKTDALKTFYPNTVLETGFDIIFFWVARMIMMGIHFMGEPPFGRVYLHAMVRDEKGEKMSKSRGNVIDPLEIVDSQGVDPLRFTFAVMAGQGRDIKLSLDRVEGYRAFCNKIWNATKFFQLHWDKGAVKLISDPSASDLEKWLLDHRTDLQETNAWILSKLQRVTKTVDRSLESFELNVGAQAIYDFVWHEFCDWFIEFSKVELSEASKTRQETLAVLVFVLERCLRLLHPYMPFVTEKLWQSLPLKKEGNPTLALQSYPKPHYQLENDEAEASIDSLKIVVDSLRAFRGENRIPPKKKFVLRYLAASKSAEKFLENNDERIRSLTNLSELVPLEKKVPASSHEAVLPLSNPPIEFRVDLTDLVDREEETKRLRKEIDRVDQDIQKVMAKLGNPSFVERAPKPVVAKEKKRELDLKTKKSELERALSRLT